MTLLVELDGPEVSDSLNGKRFDVPVVVSEFEPSALAPHLRHPDS